MEPTIAICAMGIKLTALIACRDVDFGQVPDTYAFRKCNECYRSVVDGKSTHQ